MEIPLSVLPVGWGAHPSGPTAWSGQGLVGGDDVHPFVGRDAYHCPEVTDTAAMRNELGVAE